MGLTFFWNIVLVQCGWGQRSVYRFRIKVVAFVVDFKLLLLLLLLIYDVNVFTVKVNGAFAGSLHFQGVNTRLACCWKEKNSIKIDIRTTSKDAETVDVLTVSSGKCSSLLWGVSLIVFSSQSDEAPSKCWAWIDFLRCCCWWWPSANNSPTSVPFAIVSWLPWLLCSGCSAMLGGVASAYELLRDVIGHVQIQINETFNLGFVSDSVGISTTDSIYLDRCWAMTPVRVFFSGLQRTM